ncbi:MAG TPA: phosphate ABC transporter permease subunit PstC, partial [Ilumatobacteraceae bacterium]|nr:phosphate ABC transporter permease subunit PstC [Ilumatobacteraceae bacterium]
VLSSSETSLPGATPRAIAGKRGAGDRIFHGVALWSGLIVLAIMVAVGLFLSVQATQALRASGLSFLTTARWEPDRGVFGVAAVLGFTVAIALIAVAIALPISIGTALFIVEVAPTWLRSTLIAMVDLMAAIPSVVYGLWGARLLQGQMIGLSRWLSTWFGWIPFFKVTGSDPNSALPNLTVFSASTFIAGAVVSLMVMPIQCSVMREVFSQVPMGEREGAFALGSTRWGMIRVVALPFGRGGIIGGTMLGLGRALGETIAVVLIISPRFDFSFHFLEAGSNSVSSLIALRFSEASGFGLSALMAAGLTLFAMTLVVNFVASYFVARSRSGASSEV